MKENCGGGQDINWAVESRERERERERSVLKVVL
jgi:hypothetical protein